MIAENLIEIAKYILPSIIVLITCYFLIKTFLNDEEKKRKLAYESEQKRMLLEIKSSGQKIVTPIRLQAYERIILYLERISPTTLVFRLGKNGLKADQYQQSLINAIREEFEHNLSQQIYISAKAWEFVKMAKEDMIILINTAASQVINSSDSTELARKVFEIAAEKRVLPLDSAIDFIKKEIRELF